VGLAIRLLRAPPLDICDRELLAVDTYVVWGGGVGSSATAPTRHTPLTHASALRVGFPIGARGAWWRLAAYLRFVSILVEFTVKVWRGRGPRLRIEGGTGRRQDSPYRPTAKTQTIKRTGPAAARSDGVPSPHGCSVFGSVHFGIHHHDVDVVVPRFDSASDRGIRELGACRLNGRWACLRAQNSIYPCISSVREHGDARTPGFGNPGGSLEVLMDFF